MKANRWKRRRAYGVPTPRYSYDANSKGLAEARSELTKAGATLEPYSISVLESIRARPERSGTVRLQLRP